VQKYDVLKEFPVHLSNRLHHRRMIAMKKTYTQPDNKKARIR